MELLEREQVVVGSLNGETVATNSSFTNSRQLVFDVYSIVAILFNLVPLALVIWWLNWIGVRDASFEHSAGLKYLA